METLAIVEGFDIFNEAFGGKSIPEKLSTGALSQQAPSRLML
jgi:hypothetical protein